MNVQNVYKIPEIESRLLRGREKQERPRPLQKRAEPRGYGENLKTTQRYMQRTQPPERGEYEEVRGEREQREKRKRREKTPCRTRPRNGESIWCNPGRQSASSRNLCDPGGMVNRGAGAEERENREQAGKEWCR